MAKAVRPPGFLLRAPVALEQRPAGLTLRGREGELHVGASAPAQPPGWALAARSGVAVRQSPSGVWSLAADGLAWEVPAASLRWHRPLPGLFQPLAEPFRGSLWQRLLGRGLVRLLGVPGLVPLLIRWHGRRTRQSTR